MLQVSIVVVSAASPGYRDNARCGPMRGFKRHVSASRFCRCFDELRNHLHARSRRSRNLPTNARRQRFLTRGIVALRILEAA
jgi:putative transposase